MTESSYLKQRIAQLRQWCYMNEGNNSITTAIEVWFMRALLDAYRPNAAAYVPKTTPEQRAAMLDIMGKNPLLQHGFKMLLEDLENAETGLGITNE